jgi:hypothetical protein
MELAHAQQVKLTVVSTRGIIPPDNLAAPKGALIQRGGGTGPMKPRQPGSDKGF